MSGQGGGGGGVARCDRNGGLKSGQANAGGVLGNIPIIMEPEPPSDTSEFTLSLAGGATSAASDPGVLRYGPSTSAWLPSQPGTSGVTGTLVATGTSGTDDWGTSDTEENDTPSLPGKGRLAVEGTTVKLSMRIPEIPERENYTALWNLDSSSSSMLGVEYSIDENDAEPSASISGYGRVGIRGGSMKRTSGSTDDEDTGASTSGYVARGARPRTSLAP